MRETIALAIAVFVNCFVSVGQNYPSRWTKFTSEEYIYAIEEDTNTSGVGQTAFVNSLLDRARLNVAKQVNISVSDKAKIVKEALNGVTNITYSSNTTFSTETTMRLLRTETDYQSSTGNGSAIAFLDKTEINGYWSKEAERILQEQETGLANAKKMIALGYKEKAKTALNQLTTHFGMINEPLIWLEICSYPEIRYQDLLQRYAANVRQIDDAILSLGHGITVFLDYHSDLFGEEYPAVMNQLSSNLSSEERSFVDNPLEADWIVKIVARAREGQKTTLGNNTAFFAHVDVSVTIIKGATTQTVYKDSFSVKEGDTRGMKQAAIAAFNGIVAPLANKIDNYIKE